MTPTSLASPEITTIAEPVPPNFRRRVIAFGASLAFLSFLDRAAISQAAPVIVHDLHLSPIQMGLVFSAFGLTYAACEIPSGWLCEPVWRSAFVDASRRSLVPVYRGDRPGMEFPVAICHTPAFRRR
jgi:hypothetical protein